MNAHEHFMKMALALAQKGAGFVSPNPMVGAVLVHDNQIIGEGFHAKCGEAHAEVNCIQSVAKEDEHLIPTSILYVTLEPCSHTGKTPPCSDFIIQKQIPTVVVACKDSSSKVNGKGIEKLLANGIEVVFGICEKEALELNARFFTFHNQQRPIFC